MRRGDLAIVSLPRRYGKPRPALIIQSDLFAEHPSITLLPVTSDLRDLPRVRVRIEPNASNGLREVSNVMVDKAHTLEVEKVGGAFGHLDARDMAIVDRALLLFLGLA